MTDGFNKGLILGLSMRPLPVTNAEVKKEEIVILQKAGVKDTAYSKRPDTNAADKLSTVERLNAVYKPKCTYWQTATVTTPIKSVGTTVKVKSKCLLVVAVAHRDDNIEIDGEGWSKVASSVKTQDKQTITVWSKLVNSGEYSVSVTQSTYAYMAFKLLVLYDTSKIILAENTLSSTRYITPKGATGKGRLYFVSGDYVNERYYAISIEANADENMIKMESNFFSACYYVLPKPGTAPRFKYYQNVASHMNLLSFDLELG